MREAVSRERGVRDGGRDSAMLPDRVPRQTQMGLREMTPVPLLLKPAMESCSKPIASESPEQFRARNGKRFEVASAFVSRVGELQVAPSGDDATKMSARSRPVEDSKLVESNSSHAQ